MISPYYQTLHMTYMYMYTVKVEIFNTAKFLSLDPLTKVKTIEILFLPGSTLDNHEN